MSGRKLYAADLFCGGGGTSTGLALAAESMGYDVDLVAINHDETAVETHAANHPGARHYCESLNNLDPSRLIKSGRLDLLVASPECTHFSMARGGKPCDQQSRAGAWHVLHWATRLRIDNLLIENVPAFKDWGPLGVNGRPLKSKKGATFRAFLTALRSLGYRVEMRHNIVAADYGDATTRKRLFIVATRGKAATWPAASHAKDPAAAGDLLTSSALKPWRAASEILDFGLPSASIFTRKKPLSDKTLARIAEGLRRYSGLDVADFLLPQGGGGVARSVGQPVPTVHTDGAIAHVRPLIIKQRGSTPAHIRSSAKPVDQPIDTISARGLHHGLAQAFIVPRYGEGVGQAPRTHSVDAPMPTIPGTCQHHLVQPFILKYYGTAVGQPITRPLDTVTAKPRFGLVEPAGVPLGDGKHLLDIHYRMLQPAELAAAMSFPKGYDFKGTKEQVVRQIGNAVPIRTAQALCADALRRAVA